MPLIPFSITFKRKRVSKLPSTPEPIVNIRSPQAAEPVSVIAAGGYTGPKLVEDLVPLIIAAGKWTTYDLANMARISPAWLFPSRKALYSSLHCTTVEILRGLNKTLTRNPSLSEYIRHLRIEFQKVTRGSIGTDIVQLTSLVGELFSRLSQLKTLKVDGRVALEVFQEGLANLPPTAKLRDLKLGVKKGWNGGSRDGDSALLWTSGKTSAVKSLKLLHLDGISMRVETPWEEKRLPRRLKHIKLRNSYINDPYGLPESFPLTRLEVVNEFTHPRERQEMVNSFKMLLDRYGDTLEHLSYNTVTPGPLSGDEEWQCPLLPRLIKLHTDGVYFDFQSPHIILHNCPHLEELIMYQRNPEKVVSDFISQIDVMPLSLRKVVFSSDVDEGQQSGFRPINSELVIVARQVGQARNIEVIFGKPDRGRMLEPAGYEAYLKSVAF